MTKYLFQLGTNQGISLAELEAVLGALKRVDQRVVLADLSKEIDPDSLLNRLGGVVKVAVVERELPAQASQAQILTALKEVLLAGEATKIHFAVGELGRDQLDSLDVMALKRELEEVGAKVRFAQTPRQGAGAALLGHRKKIQEMLVVSGRGSGDDEELAAKKIYLARTVAVQDIDEWTRRDRGKPYADHKKGMLPPKLARVMVNLAGQTKESPLPQRLYDPFCGTGTILMEAQLGGWEVLGSDADPQAVTGTRENLTWLSEGEQSALMFTAEAARVSLTQVGGQQVSAIVTEPFLGRQTPKDKQLPNIFRGLAKLYWGAFRQWRQLLKDGGRVVIVFPRVKSDQGRNYNLDHLLDKLEEIGYTKCSKNLFYARPNAIVEREICVFDYKLKEK